MLLKTHRIDRRGYIAKVADFGKPGWPLLLPHRAEIGSRRLPSITRRCSSISIHASQLVTLLCLLEAYRLACTHLSTVHAAPMQRPDLVIGQDTSATNAEAPWPACWVLC